MTYGLPVQGPVHWGAYPGEYLELVMAVLVAQDHPDTLRRTPASGDGGIDLMVPDGHGFEVRQVKRFTHRIGASERRQIKETWDTLRADPRLSRPITAYRLVVPVDPTPDEQEWFDNLVADSPWPATWRGEVHWHDLASRHPHVIDYLFGGGRDRVARRSRALQSTVIDPGHPLRAIDAAGSLAVVLSALNRDDPHYRYEILTSPTMPSRDELPNCALAQTQRVVDGGYLTILVIPRHRYSLQDAPIGGTFKVEIPDPEAAARFQEAFTCFENFGRALDLPEGMVSGKITAPGGLGGAFEAGGGWIGPVPSSAEHPPLRLVAVSSDGEKVLGELTLEILSVTTGRAGGTEIRLADSTRLFTGELRLMPPNRNDPEQRTLTFSFAIGEIIGQPVLRVLPVVRLLSLFELPNELQLRPEYGNQVLARSPLEQVGYMTESAQIHLEDLATLQSYADQPVLVPEAIDPPLANDLHELARMLRGETITGSWDNVTMHLQPGVSRDEFATQFATQFAGEAPLALEQEISVTLGGQTIALGPFTTIMQSSHFGESQPEDESLAVLEPLDDISYTRRAGPVVPT